VPRRLDGREASVFSSVGTPKGIELKEEEDDESGEGDVEVDSVYPKSFAVSSGST